jgi:hypothetical protein
MYAVQRLTQDYLSLIFCFQRELSFRMDTLVYIIFFTFSTELMRYFRRILR